jgi:hypothetical protein
VEASLSYYPGIILEELRILSKAKPVSRLSFELKTSHMKSNWYVWNLLLENEFLVCAVGPFSQVIEVKWKK